MLSGHVHADKIWLDHVQWAVFELPQVMLIWVCVKVLSKSQIDFDSGSFELDNRNLVAHHLYTYRELYERIFRNVMHPNWY